MYYPRAPWPQARRGRTEEDATTDPTHPTTTKGPPESCHSIQAGRRQRAGRRARALLPRLPLVLALSAALLVMLASPAFAAGTATPTLSGVIDNLRNWIVGILAGVATLFLTIGGLRYLTAGGDPGQVEKAKIALKSAAIGYALAILAPLLVSILASIVGG
nr:pilin [Acidiferrimicrobium sp. IK]